MKTLLHTFLHLLKYKLGFLSKYEVAKLGVNGKADSTVIGLTFRG
jgi:hypothetical protein